MTPEEVLGTLRALRLAGHIGGFACLGCGREHNCSIHGCTLIREAEQTIKLLIAERDALRRRLAEGGTDRE